MIMGIEQWPEKINKTRGGSQNLKSGSWYLFGELGVEASDVEDYFEEEEE